jgi:hypothetical protein
MRMNWIHTLRSGGDWLLRERLIGLNQSRRLRLICVTGRWGIFEARPTALVRRETVLPSAPATASQSLPGGANRALRRLGGLHGRRLGGLGSEQQM